MAYVFLVFFNCKMCVNYNLSAINHDMHSLFDMASCNDTHSLTAKWDYLQTPNIPLDGIAPTSGDDAVNVFARECRRAIGILGKG